MPVSITQQSATSPSREFLAFVEKAERILRSRDRQSHVIEFEAFARKALPLIVDDLRGSLSALAARAELASSWLVSHDLLSVAGFGFVENSYTELMRWALDPATHPASALRRQRAWLDALGIDPVICGGGPCVGRTQVVTGDGIPDLVLEFPAGVVVVEAKTGSAEHAAPSGAMQTIAYAEELRRRMPGKAVEMVFITPDGSAAANPKARNTTFLEFVFAIAEALKDADLLTDTRAAYGMLFTHFLTHATTSKLDLRKTLRRIVGWSREPDWMSDRNLLDRIDELLAAVALILPEPMR